MRNFTERVCPICEVGFVPTYRSTQMFCSALCRTRKWKLLNPDKYKEDQRLRAERRRRLFPKTEEERRKAAQYLRELNRSQRLETLDAYGGLTCNCQHEDGPCGPKPYEFLAIDHIGGRLGRWQDRRSSLHRYLRANGYPEGYRVLCHNCNSALGVHGICPLSKTERQQRWCDPILLPGGAQPE